MSSDVRFYLQCLGCNKKERLVRFTIAKPEVILDNKITEFISKHLICNNYLFNDVFGRNTNKDSGFVIIRENDGDLKYN